MSALRAAARGLKRTLRPNPAQHNMHEDQGEQFYLTEYLAVLDRVLSPQSRVLDVGCQYGRLLLPLTDRGHHVVGTDIDADCLRYISSQNPSVELRLEPADVTAASASGGYDLVACLELLYHLPTWREVLAGLAQQVRPGAYLAASHRTLGYYAYRMVRDGRFDEIEAVRTGTHPTYNAQSPDELRSEYERCGLQVVTITPIGTFSGIAGDPLSALADPTTLSAKDRSALADLERNPELTGRFAELARYLLVVAKRAD